MDQRRAAGALLALVVCIASTAAAPTASNQTTLDLYDGSAEGCYYNFQHYGEGDRIMTNEPCLNCTCHNRMLMCYLRVCPFTKPIGQDCTVEKRADQCCPIVTCPDVPVDLLTSTSTTSPAEYGATGVGKLDKYGCSINGKYFPEGSKVPPTANKPCEHCYCIRNMTTCVMQECTLHVDGCTPIYHKDVCCPVRYSCDHQEDTTLLLDDMTTTVRPTPGFLLTTTTLSPVTQMSQDCVHDDQIFPDGALIKTEKACEHCYCMKGDIVCVVQECGTPMENEGKNCTSQPPREGQCCPDTYICEGDEATTEPPSDYSTQSQLEDLTTISPPRRVGVEGSGYRNEPDEPVYTESPSMETEAEGSGYEQSTEPAVVDLLTSQTPEISSEFIDDSLYSSKTTVRTPTLEEVEKTTEPDKGLNTVPSDARDEEMYKPSITEKTPFEEPKVTETILTSDEKEVGIEVKTTSSEGLFMPVMTTNREESTTESAFRKEDTLGETTEFYDQGEPEKMSTLATDIKKETQEEVASSTTKTPFMEELEKPTTLSPEFTQKDIDLGISPKESTTESILEVTTTVDIKPTDKLTTDSVQLSQTEMTTPTVEKEVPETTGLEQNEIEDITTTLPPGRIPGEGDCLLNDITYRNNSNVPSSNNCHTSCRCVSSIIKCDPIICSPPPEYMDNCQPTYDSPDSCCPTYVCHTGETMPPQPHSQMSGTDSPLPSVSIECHGDECEVKKDDNVPIVGDCGSAECDDGHSGIPETPSEDCHDGKCTLPSQPCTGGNCQEIPTAHCENGKCGVEPEILPVKDIPLCENESDCKETVPESASCEGKDCVKVNVGCSGTDCSTDAVKPPCVEGSCQETPVTHCENGKCDIEPQIVPVKDIPLCENESDCKETVPVVPSCEGEGCVSGNVECIGTDCSTDGTKPPVIPGQEGNCEGDCKTSEDENIQPCTETSCRRKETGEVDSSLPSDCSSSDCILQVPSKEDDTKTKIPVTDDTGIKSTQQPEITVSHEITTESPELQTKVSDDTSEYQTTETVVIASDDGSTNIPLPQATKAPSEDKVLETVPSSQFDHTTESQLDQEDTATKSPQMVEEALSTLGPHISVTDKTRISDIDAITKEPQVMVTKVQDAIDMNSPVTESQDISTKVDSEESLQTGTTQDVLHSEPTEGPLDTELHDIRTVIPQELSTSKPEKDDTKTQSPDHYDELSTKAPEQEQTESLIPHMPDGGNVNKVTEEPLPYTSEIDMITSTKLPEINVEQHVTEPDDTEVLNVSSHDVTESNEIGEKATKAPESAETTSHQMTTEMFQHELTTEGAVTVTESQESEIFTKISEATTAKVPEDTPSVTSENPELYKTEKQESFTETSEEFTGSLESVTKQTVITGEETVLTESPEFPTDETKAQPEVPVSVEDTKSQTTLAPPVTDTEVKVQSYTTIMEESTTTSSLTDEKITISEPAEKPEDQDHEQEQPTDNPATNEVTQEIVQNPSEPPITTTTLQEDQNAKKPDSEVTKSDKTVTEKSDTSFTEQPFITEDDYKPEQVTESAQEITKQQEISTDEPSISPVTDEIPSEPYVTVQPETITESATVQPGDINKVPDVEPDTQTPATNEVMEFETKVPDRSGLNEATEVSEKMETESPKVKEPETATEIESTQPPELFSETPTIEKIDKDEPPISTEIPTSSEDFATKVKLESGAPEIFTTKMPAVDEVPEKIPTPEIVPEEQELESVTTERMIEQPSDGEQEGISKPDKYSTLSVIQETTVASVKQQEVSKETTESDITESDTPLYATIAPESHVKVPQEPVTVTADTFTTQSLDSSVSVPQDKILPGQMITEGPQEVTSDVPKEKPEVETPDVSYDKQPEEKPDVPQDTFTKTPDETSTVLLEIATEPTRAVISTVPTQEVIPVITQESDSKLQEEEKTPEEMSTEKPDKEETLISQLPEELFTGSSIGLETVVTETTQYKVTEAHVAKEPVTISTDKQENITLNNLQETMTTVLQESPEQPQESSTKMPQDITFSETDLEQQDRYTVAVSQVTTLGALPDIVTDAPEKTETGSPQEEEMHLTTLKTPQTDVIETSPEQVTVEIEQATKEPTAHGTQEPDDAEKETMTDAPVSPTQDTSDEELTMPDVVELEEHSHKPVEEITTVATTEEEIIPSLPQAHDEEKQTPQVTTEKQTSVTEIYDEKVSKPSDEFSPEISMVTAMDLGEMPMSTLSPSNEEGEQHTDIPTTSQSGIQALDQRYGDETSSKEQQPIQPSPIPDTEIPVQTEKVLTDEVTESELSHETTMLEEVSAITTKATTEKETEESLTQKPEYTKPLEENSEDKPMRKPQEELGEKPLEEPTETPIQESEQKPLEPIETETSEKPTTELELKPSETPIEEPTMTPLATDEPQVGEDDKPTETPEQIPQEGAEEKPTKTPELKPFEEPTETPQEKPLEGTEDKSTERPLEATDNITDEKAEEKPLDESGKTTTENPEDKPLKQPEEKPQELPEGESQQIPEKPLEVSEKKPQDVPKEQPLELPEEKPEEKPLKASEDEPSEIPQEHPQEMPEEKPLDVSESKPDDLSDEKQQEVPKEKPAVLEEKPAVLEEKPEVSEGKPQESPEKQPQELPEKKPEVPDEKSQELPEETLQEVPEQKPEGPEEKPQVLPEEKPQEVPDQKPGVTEEKPEELPEEKPQELPEDKPQELPEEKPEEVPEEKPEVPEKTSEDITTEKPQEIPEEKPEMPEQKPEVPEKTSEDITTEKPQEIPEEKPEMPEQKPQDVPTEKPQEIPDEKPEMAEEKPQELPEEKPQEIPQEKPEEKPQEVPEDKPVESASTASPELSKPVFGDMQPTDEVPDDDNQFPSSGGTSGYGTEPDYVEEDQAFGPGTCRYGGKVYVSAQQIPRDDPCDFCFCFRSDIICLQQSCPPPIHGCHEEPIQGFCCPRYECPVAMATTLNVTTTTTTTTTTLPPHFLPHAYKGAAQRRGCQIKGHTYKVGEVVRASSGPCLHCTCGGDGQMKCDPKACTPEPMLRQMIAAAVSAKRRR